MALKLIVVMKKSDLLFKAKTKTKMRLLTTLLLGAATFFVNAQNVALVTAYNMLSDGKLDEAAQAIEPATTHAKTAQKEKTFRYRGLIYQGIVTSEDEALKTKYPNALLLAVESFLRANELDTKGAYKKDNRKNLAGLQGLSLNTGNDEFTAKNYTNAIQYYQTCERIASTFGIVDSNAVFNQALAYESAKESDKALSKYQQLLDIGYNKPEIYRYMANLKKQNGDLDGALDISKQGMTRYPDNKDIILDVMSYSLEAGRSDEAEKIVAVAIEKDPQNPVLHSVAGSLFDQKAQAAVEAKEEEEMQKWYDMAEAAYKKSIEVDENYFDAYFNIGVLYNNRAAFIYDKIKDIKSDTEYIKAKKGADEVYLTAVPYFEKAHSLRPDDVQVIQQLVKLYGKTGDDVKWKAMKEKLSK